MDNIKCTSIRIMSDTESKIEMKYGRNANPPPTPQRTNVVTDKQSTNNNEQKLPLKRKIKQEPGKAKRNRKLHKKRWSLQKKMEGQNKKSPSIINTYKMSVSNFPALWTYAQVFDFVSRELVYQGGEMEMEPEGKNNKPELRISFKSLKNFNDASRLLHGKTVEGNLLQVEVEGGHNEEDNGNASNANVFGPRTPNPDAREEDPDGLYWLKREFLDMLNIKPPLGHWIHVSNFRCDKSELREILELAGRVISCLVVNVAHKYAKVMYAHPLEAVQAISMLNGQLYYGMALRVEMDVCQQEQMLPKGLAGIGPGLGPNGEIARDIKSEYERICNRRRSCMNQSLFNTGNIGEIVLPPSRTALVLGNDRGGAPWPSMSDRSEGLQTSTQQQVANTQDQTPPVGSTVPGVTPPFFRGVHNGVNSNVRMSTPPLNPTNPRTIQGGTVLAPSQGASTHSLLPRDTVSMPSAQMPYAPPQPQSAPPMSVPQPNQNNDVRALWPNYAPGPAPQMFRGSDAITLKITNLPLKTTFLSLCCKLTTLAHLTLLQFTTPGCAVAKFSSPAEAEKCLQNYRAIELF